MKNVLAFCRRASLRQPAPQSTRARPHGPPHEAGKNFPGNSRRGVPSGKTPHAINFTAFDGEPDTLVVPFAPGGEQVG